MGLLQGSYCLRVIVHCIIEILMYTIAFCVVLEFYCTQRISQLRRSKQASYHIELVAVIHWEADGKQDRFSKAVG